MNRYYNKTGKSSSTVTDDQTLPTVPLFTSPVEQETNTSDINNNSEESKFSITPEMKQLIRNTHRSNNQYDQISDEAAMGFGILLIVGFVVLVFYSLRGENT